LDVISWQRGGKRASTRRHGGLGGSAAGAGAGGAAQRGAARRGARSPPRARAWGLWSPVGLRGLVPVLFWLRRSRRRRRAVLLDFTQCADAAPRPLCALEAVD